MKEYLLRSLLFVPAYNEKFIDNALNCNADAIIIDLEDAVPAVFKADARKILGQYIVKGAFKNKTVFIRFNSFDSGELMKDIETLLSDDIDGVVLTKINSAQDIAYYDDLFNKVESEKGYAKGHFKFLPLIETAEAVINAFSIAKASERVIALCFGAEDYLNDIMGIHGNPPVALNYPRAVIATAARAAGVYPIDTPYLVLKNPEGFMEEEKLSFEMGYAGALLIHPSQIELANVCFMPSETEIERSRNILEAVEKSKKAGSGVTMLNGKMVGLLCKRKLKKHYSLLIWLKEMKNIRSLLFVPAVEKKMQNIGHFEEEPDAYIIDIEDSIKLEAKEDALHSVIRYLNNSIYLEKIYVRINKEFWERDIDYLIKNNINRVVFPKAEDDGEIKKVIAKYSDIEIIALIETPKGILHVENICQLDNVVALAFGGEDYFALLGVPYSYEASLYPKSKIVICSNAYGKSCFDTIYPSVRNVQGLIDATNLSKKLGFSGKLAIHPNQIKIIDDIFTQEDMDKYRKILEKYESDKSGVIEFEGRIYEKPHIEMLKRILDDFEVN